MFRSLLLLILFLPTLAALTYGEEKTNVSPLRRGHGSRSKSAELKITALQVALEEYRTKCGAYPTNEQGGLHALFRVTPGSKCVGYEPLDPRDTAWLKDPWGREFTYDSFDGKSFKIISLGRDGKAGGMGDNEDITADDRGTKSVRSLKDPSGL